MLELGHLVFVVNDFIEVAIVLLVDVRVVENVVALIRIVYVVQLLLQALLFRVENLKVGLLVQRRG